MGDGPGFPSSLAGGSSSGQEANENQGGAGSHWHAQPKQGWLAWWVPREGQRLKTVGKKRNIRLQLSVSCISVLLWDSV